MELWAILWFHPIFRGVFLANIRDVNWRSCPPDWAVSEFLIVLTLFSWLMNNRESGHTQSLDGVQHPCGQKQWLDCQVTLEWPLEVTHVATEFLYVLIRMVEETMDNTTCWNLSIPQIHWENTHQKIPVLYNPGWILHILRFASQSPELCPRHSWFFELENQCRLRMNRLQPLSGRAPRAARLFLAVSSRPEFPMRYETWSHSLSPCTRKLGPSTRCWHTGGSEITVSVAIFYRLGDSYRGNLISYAD